MVMIKCKHGYRGHRDNNTFYLVSVRCGIFLVLNNNITSFLHPQIQCQAVHNLYFSVGSTPLGMYRKLVEFCRAGTLSFKHVVTFNMDEYVDLPRDHPESYHSFMFKNLFNHIDIDPKNVHIPDGNAPDLVKECKDFEDKMKSFGGVELFIGGVW